MSRATKTSDIVIRDIESISEMRAVESLEKEVWECADRDIVPLTMLAAARESGGILIGAFDGPLLVGFAFGFVGQEDGEIVHHSHMLAVNSSHRSFNLGYSLKLAQRARALEQGIKRMTWTFDPLQSLNAYFNFNKLGVLADKYKVNFYGETTSSPLHQTGTDRLWVTWLLDSARVKERVQRNSIPDLSNLTTNTLIRCSDANIPERIEGISDTAGNLAIEIPSDINSIEHQDPDLARAWREETRAAFQETLRSGFVVAEFVRGGSERPGNAYLLRKGSLDELA
jgi:predicted GNAT superfamily acetyltransferase